MIDCIYVTPSVHTISIYGAKYYTALERMSVLTSAAIGWLFSAITHSHDRSRLTYRNSEYQAIPQLRKLQRK